MRTAIRKNLADFLAILGVVVLGIGIGAYILANQRLRFPLIEDKPYTVKAELSDAQAVTPGQGQTVVVAGVRVGDIGKVELEDGKAVVELQLEPKYRGLLTEDASALLRAKTGTKDMFLEVDPGEGKPLAGRRPDQVSNTLPDIDPDEFLAALDSDTRDYLKLLISGAGKGLDGRGTDLREVLKRLGPLHRDLARVSRAVAERRHNMRRLVNRYGLLMAELGKSDKDITRLVRTSNVTLGAFADEDQNISALVSKLPGTLDQTATTLGKVDTLAKQMGPTFESLRAAVPQARRGQRRGAAVRRRRRRRSSRRRCARSRARRSRSSATSARRRRTSPTAGPRPDRPRSAGSTGSSTSAPTTRAAPRASARTARRRASARARSGPATRATSTGSPGSARTPSRCSRRRTRSARSGAPTWSTSTATSSRPGPSRSACRTPRPRA